MWIGPVSAANFSVWRNRNGTVAAVEVVVGPSMGPEARKFGRHTRGRRSNDRESDLGD
jgi:hypothetical protein